MSNPYRDRQVDLDFTLLEEWSAYRLPCGLNKLALALHNSGKLDLVLKRLRQVREGTPGLAHQHGDV